MGSKRWENMIRQKDTMLVRTCKCDFKKALNVTAKGGVCEGEDGGKGVVFGPRIMSKMSTDGRGRWFHL